MRYKRSVATFVDILGFAEIVGDGEGNDAANVDDLLDALDKTAGQPVGEVGAKTSVLTFSDSVIRSRPLDGESIYDALLAEVQDLATAQWTLLEAGVLIRGGTTVGDMVLDERRAFGPAFVRAYRLESGLANAPRIVIDPAVIEQVRGHLKAVPSRSTKRNLIEDLKSHLRLGDDGIWFIDYIKSVSLMNEAAYVRDALGTMRAFIIDKAESLPPSSLILPKYLWLIRYHNQSVGRVFPSARELKIRSSDVPAADELLKPIRIKKPPRR
ncbi:hypothetical protein FHS95_003767 [Sphingomonas naasensis]|uniref:Guanylate cyclase domain-containing protein n=1 Tax=Sphingomonas naasensis TaxID=1344951 RepID=A0A4S1WKG5_9SPHN|nr:hypothetical protein [Sphingomonas naasensis]NIJ22056.1 hypothetical protein [Sphingomonas naasensis]TGX42270.1 hypothetical protein E5A74_10465 [Sphingomonas naasensis]